MPKLLDFVRKIYQILNKKNADEFMKKTLIISDYRTGGGCGCQSHVRGGVRHGFCL